MRTRTVDVGGCVRERKQRVRTLGTFRTTRASRRFPTARFQSGIAAMYACTGASPSAFAICGLPPERRATAPRLAFAGDLDLVGEERCLLARAVRLVFALAFRRHANGSLRDSSRGPRFMRAHRRLFFRGKRGRPAISANVPSMSE